MLYIYLYELCVFCLLQHGRNTYTDGHTGFTFK